VKRFYVAPGGNDAWGGGRAAPDWRDSDGPFATVARARQAVREYRIEHPAAAGVDVVIRGGRYRLAAPLVFAPEDSGSPECPVTYRAYRDEQPVFSGGMRVEGWEPVPGTESSVWRARVPSIAGQVPRFNQLFADGVRLQRACIPNEGVLRMAGPSDSLPQPQLMFRFEPGDLQRWPGLGDVALLVFHARIGSWHWIRDLDLDQHVVTLTNRGSTKPFGDSDPRQRYVVENVAEALDAPGEWFLSADGIVYYVPYFGQRPPEMHFDAPVVTGRLVELTGNPATGRLVEHLAFEGLAFEHVDWPVLKTTWYDWQDFSALKQAAIYARGARSCRIERCRISQVGCHGIYLDEGCRDTVIRQCHIRDTGAGGIVVGDRGRLRGRRAVTGNIVENNLVHDLGNVFPGSVGIYLGSVSSCRVAHNHVADNDWCGIAVGYGRPGRGDNVVEFNRVHRIGRGVLGELGGIYTMGVSPGSVIRCNLIHDVSGYPETPPAAGIYCDGNSAGYTVERNVIFNIDGPGFFRSGTGADIIVRSNVFANCTAGGVKMDEGSHPGVSVDNNLVRDGGSEEELARDVMELDSVGLQGDRAWIKFGRDLLKKTADR
jgi:hypothetical protein